MGNYQIYHASAKTGNKLEMAVLTTVRSAACKVK
jgi:hypothetical protein